VSARDRFSSASPQEALAAVAARLREWYRTSPEPGAAVRLDPVAGELPTVWLSLQREQRLFSRTLPLLVTADASGDGPPGDSRMAMRRRRVRRRFELGWVEGPPSTGAATALQRFAGLAEGAATMTNVRELEVAWTVSDRRWRLRVETLAGALIGTSPGHAVAVPLEPEDVEGLLQILRAFARGASG
jgi:hypothetical protein